MRWSILSLALLVGCTVLTSPGDYEGGSVDGGLSCTGDGECPSGFCDTDRGECVECRSTTDCSAGEECRGGSCGPETCGGDVCPDAMPVCLVDGTEAVCVECVSPTDCSPGESCGADNRCAACMPATACAADEACVIDAAGDYCVDCDADDDGEIRRDPLCEAVAGDRDCDDDGDGFCMAIPECAGECDEVAVDCDDMDATARPAIVACRDPAFTRCSEPGDLLPGAGVASVSVIALGALPEPVDPNLRTPMSVVAEAGAVGLFDVVYLEGGGAVSYSDRTRRVVDIDARDFRTLPLPPTDLRDFTDLRAKGDSAGTVIGALGTDVDSGMTAIEGRLVESFEGATIGSPVSYMDPDAVPPIDVSVEMLASSMPYVVWCADKGDVYDIRAGSSGTLFSEPAILAPADSLIINTARGLVSAGIREQEDLVYWDPRAVFEGSEPRDEMGGAALAAGLSTLGFDARFAGGQLVVRSIMFTEGGYVTNDPTTFDEADASSRVAITSYDNVGFIVFDGPSSDGDRRLFASRAGDAGGGTAATARIELTGTNAPDFDLIHGLEVAARSEGGTVELAVLVHGVLVGDTEPGLYLFLARRCAS